MVRVIEFLYSFLIRVADLFVLSSLFYHITFFSFTILMKMVSIMVGLFNAIYTNSPQSFIQLILFPVDFVEK